MERFIYHGSNQIVRNPVFGSGSAYNDFGLGFYCSENPDLAAEWAVSRYANGFVNKYRIETTGLRMINLNSPEYCILHWLSVLLSYREFDAGSPLVFRARDYIQTMFSVDYQNCDCIIGFRADNSNFSFAQSFLNGRMSYREFNDAVRLGDTGRQFVLKSNRAFDRVTFDSYTVAKYADSYPAAIRRDLAARRKTSFGDIMRIPDKTPSAEIMHVTGKTHTGKSMHAKGRRPVGETMNVKDKTMTGEILYETDKTLAGEDLHVKDKTLDGEALRVKDKATTGESLHVKDKPSDGEALRVKDKAKTAEINSADSRKRPPASDSTARNDLYIADIVDGNIRPFDKMLL